jgi:ABC-type branched-subunit amino acid transport system substrate-binding protein
MRRYQKLSVRILVLAVVISVLTCISIQKSQAAAKELKIGALVNLKSVEGVELQRWLNLFAKMYNDKGGWQIGKEKYLVKPMIYDVGQMDVAKTRSATERAVFQDGIKFIVCSWGDVPEEVVTITEPNKVMWMGVTFRNDTADPKYKYVVRGQGLFFGYGMGYTIQKDTKERGVKTDLIINPDSQFGKIGTMQWTGSAKVAGLEVLEPIFFNMNTTDFAPIATKIKNVNPDFVEFPFVSDDQIPNIISALKDVGYKGKVYPGNIGPRVLENIVKKVGKEYVEGWECVYYDPKGFVKDPEINSLIDAYVKEYKEWRSEGCFWISPWFFFKDAIENTQSVDVDTVVKYLHNMKKGVKTFGGYSQLFARPDLKNYQTIDSAPGCYVALIKDGKLVPFKAVAVKDHYLVTIKAMGLTDVYEKYWAEYGKPTFPPQPSMFDFADLKK